MSTFNTLVGILLLWLLIIRITICVWPILQRVCLSIRSNINSRFAWTAFVANFIHPLQTNRKGFDLQECPGERKSQGYPFDECVLAGVFCTGSVCTAFLKALREFGSHPIMEKKQHHVTQVANHTAQIKSTQNNSHGELWAETCSNKPFIKQPYNKSVHRSSTKPPIDSRSLSMTSVHRHSFTSIFVCGGSSYHANGVAQGWWWGIYTCPMLAVCGGVVNFSPAPPKLRPCFCDFCIRP